MTKQLPEPRFYVDENGVEMVEHPMFRARKDSTSERRQFEMILVQDTAEDYRKTEELLRAIESGKLADEIRKRGRHRRRRPRR